jgi:hypothetical protein
MDREIQQTLSSQLPEDIKAKLYQNILSKYVGNKKFVPSQWETDNNSPDLVEQELLESVPSQSRYKARRIVRAIKDNPEAQWNGRGEFVYRQRVIPQSHVIDLVSDILKTSTIGNPPTGWEEFALSLKNSQLPSEVIPNKQRWKFMHKINDNIEKVQNTPPSKKRKSKEQDPEVSSTVKQRRNRSTRSVKQWVNFEDIENA